MEVPFALHAALALTTPPDPGARSAEADDAAAEADGGALPAGLLARFVAGDRDAFRVVFERLSRDLYLVAGRYFRGAFDRDEALQECWLQIYRMRHRFDVNRSSAFVGWARQVARNRCLDLLKAQSRKREVPMDSSDTPRGDAPADSTSTRGDQLDALHGERVRAVLERFVAELDAEQRAFFKLCFVEERAHDEIAAALEITVRRSKYLKKKLLERLQKSASLRRVRAGQ